MKLKSNYVYQENSLSLEVSRKVQCESKEDPRVSSDVNKVWEFTLQERSEDKEKNTVSSAS